MSNKWDNIQTNKLIKVILTLRNEQEARKFFRDLLTEAELIEFGKRWQAAQMLDRKIPYSEIENKTGLSSTTVARISKWLKKGMGGYQLMLSRTKNHHSTLSLSKKG